MAIYYWLSGLAFVGLIGWAVVDGIRKKQSSCVPKVKKDAPVIHNKFSDINRQAKYGKYHRTLAEIDGLMGTEYVGSTTDKPSLQVVYTDKNNMPLIPSHSPDLPYTIELLPPHPNYLDRTSKNQTSIKQIMDIETAKTLSDQSEAYKNAVEANARVLSKSEQIQDFVEQQKAYRKEYNDIMKDKV